MFELNLIARSCKHQCSQFPFLRRICLLHKRSRNQPHPDKFNQTFSRKKYADTTVVQSSIKRCSASSTKWLLGEQENRRCPEWTGSPNWTTPKKKGGYYGYFSRQGHNIQILLPNCFSSTVGCITYSAQGKKTHLDTNYINQTIK